MEPLLPWKRVRSALFQYMCAHGISKRRFEHVAHILPQLMDLCGSYSHSRRTAMRVGICLLQRKPRLLATVCPDYAHQNGRYTYEGLLDGVPMLVEIHETFLQKVIALVPDLKVGLLIADHEADFEPLRQSVRLSRDEFLDRVASSIKAAGKHVRDRRWSVRTFTGLLPHFRQAVDERTRQLEADPSLSARLASETLSRSTFYRRVGYPTEVWSRRSAEIAAQYTILGEHCASNNILICNHSTISLSWFIRAGAGFLENPVAIH
jgi:hypothetical protein